MVTHDVEEAVLMSDRVLITDATSKRIDDEFSVNLPRGAQPGKPAAPHRSDPLLPVQKSRKRNRPVNGPVFIHLGN